MLTRDDIRRALLALARELEDASIRCEVVVVGGAALVLLYAARQATKDVDVAAGRAAPRPRARDEGVLCLL